jgi:hypothetical protein
VRRMLFALVAAVTSLAVVNGSTPVCAQGDEVPRMVVPAGSGLVSTGHGVKVVPLSAAARFVSSGPHLRVAGCYWTRERGPKGWVRFRVCG